MKLLAMSVLLGSAALGGCATTKDAYDWGNYDEMLYRSYKDATKIDAYRVGLETHIAAVEKKNGRVPPGLYAEVGTAYLQRGDSDRAIEWYSRERAAWPESKGLMDVMIANLERRKKAPEEPQ
jgi:hypothetical protein